MLKRLEACANGIIEIGRSGLFDVRAEDVSDRLAVEKVDQARDGLLVLCPVVYIKASGVERVPAKQETGPCVVVSDIDGVMARDR